MANIQLTDAEAQAIKLLLSPLVVRARTGELGLMHGADRFVSSQVRLKKADLQNAQSALTKIGITLRRDDG